MTQWGLDYAWGWSPGFAATLKANGCAFICRYINDPGGKGMTAAERNALISHGMIICPVYEVTGTDFSGGYNAGHADGQAAASAMRSLGAPAGSYCWFAIDTGTSDFASTNAYLSGAKAGTGEYIAQLYGSDQVCEHAAAAGLGSYHWQTYAWSSGAVSGHAALYQYQNDVNIGGVSCDRDRTLKTVLGPWAHFTAIPAPPAPPPKPGTVPDCRGRSAGNAHNHITSAQLTPAAPAGQMPSWICTGTTPASGNGVPLHSDVTINASAAPEVSLNATGQWAMLAQLDLNRAGAGLMTDGSFGPVTELAVEHYQEAHGLTRDGVIGPATWTSLGSL
jgi:hypothetical protein